MKVEIDINGDIKVNSYELLRAITESMDEESLEEFYDAFVPLSTIYKKLISSLRSSTLVTNNYNPDYFKLFKKFFMLDFFDSRYGTKYEVISVMSGAIKSILKENLDLYRKANETSEILHELFSYIQGKYGQEAKEDIRYRLIDLQYRREAPGEAFYTETLGEAEMFAKNLSKQWVETIYKIFNEEKEND